MENMFTPVDHAIIRSAVKRLPGLLALIVELRFWKKQSPTDIAVELGVTVRSVEISLKRACMTLREECLRHPAFSRSKHQMLQFLQTQISA